MDKKVGIWVILIHVFFTCTTHSQRLELKFDDILDNNLLTSPITTSIIRDSTGFMWIGTDQGLNRFDGYTIKKYDNSLKGPGYIPQIKINTLFTDSKEALWVGTLDGICKYLAKKDSFVVVSGLENSKGILNFNIETINENKHGSIFVSDKERIYCYDQQQDTFKVIIRKKENAIASFIFDKEGFIWFGNALNGELYRYDTLGRNHGTFFQDEQKQNASPIYDLVLKNDDLWLATYGSGIIKFNIPTRAFTKYPYENTYMSYVLKMYLDNDKRVWAIDLTGAKLYDDSLDIFHGYYRDEGNENSLKEAPVAMYQDKQNNYWFAHKDMGISFCRALGGFYYYNTNKQKYWATISENISALCEDHNGNLWLGSGGNGIDVFYWNEDKIETFQYNESYPRSLGAGAVGSIYRDSKNRMWVGTYLGGLQLFLPEKKTFKTFNHNPDDKSSISGNDIRSIAEDTEGNLWLVTHGVGIDKFNPRTGKFVHYNTQNSGLANNWAFDILADNKNNIWVAGSWGLSVLNVGEARFNVYNNHPDDSNSIDNNQITCLHQDDQGRIWVGTEQGVNLYNEQGNNFERINLDGRHFIADILSTDEGYIWLSTHSGIIRYNPDNKTFHLFDENDGLISKIYNVNSGYANQDKTLFFGGTKGVAVIYTDEVKINKTPPKVIITDFKLFYKSISQYPDQNIVEGNIAYTPEIQLKHNQNVIGFEFAALNMIQPDKNNFEYKLEGFDKTWIMPEKTREAVYTNLDPGKYTFRVRASNNDGIWNESGAAIAVVVHPPWWGTWWFRVFASLFVLLIISIIYFLRIQQLQKQKVMLQHVVDEKTNELRIKNEILMQQADDLNNVNTLLEERQQRIEDQSEELKAQAENLTKTVHELETTNASKDKMFSIISHDLRSPFSGIKGFSEILIESYYELDDPDRLRMLTNIQSSTELVSDLLENLLTWSRSQTKSVAFMPEKINVSQLINDTVPLVKNVFEQKHINLKSVIEPEAFVFADANMLNTVIRNLLSNAVKFTNDNGQVVVTVVKEKEYITIRVKDNGIGISEEMIKDLFEISRQKVRKGTKGEKGSGLGLLLCKEFVERNKGKFDVESLLNKGTTFIVKLPLV